MTASLLFRIASLLRAASFRKSFACSVPFPHPEAPLAPGCFCIFCIKKKEKLRFFDVFPIFFLTSTSNISYYGITNSPRELENTTDLL